ncbi:N-acetyltransferase [uncultured Maritalea sp.]|jgi:predicted N-acetyltransferase YhbS|uniref:GNAT family N-acetyltransferase n=1 Tax=uncultured Maritalea sp. TaxID=757249 RepID=UPI00260C92FE|nr:N-acetyltransferase [uncultured Maritalea sp.]
MTILDITNAQQPELAQNLSALAIRLETNSDESWIEDLHDACFGPGRFARAAFRIRERFGVDERLSLVAELDGQPVATVKMSAINISDQNGYLLGPLATDPNRRKLGAGKALVREVVAKAFEVPSCAFVLLVGDAPYYGPLGFEPTLPERIEFPAPVDPERVLVAAKDATMIKRLNGPISQWVD